MASAPESEDDASAQFNRFMEQVAPAGNYSESRSGVSPEQPLPDFVTVECLLKWTLKNIQPKPETCFRKFVAVTTSFRLPSTWFLSVAHGGECQALTFDTDLESLYSQCVRVFFESGKCPEVPENEQSHFEDDGFEGVALKAVWSMRCFIILLQNFNEVSGKNLGRRFVELLSLKGVHLALEHVNEEHPWASEESVSLASVLLQSIFKINDCSELDKLLCVATYKEAPSGYFEPLFKVIAPRLTKDDWKQNPSDATVFCACLFNIKFPHASEHLHQLLPPSLLFIDDVQVENKILGVKCLQHIIDNVSASELCWYGRAQVIYNALQHQLYTREEQLLSVVLPCLLSILQVIEGPRSQSIDLHKATKFDEIAERILADMELEQQLVQRRIYAQHLPRYISTMGIRVVRHLQRLVTVLISYLEIHDGEKEVARIYALDILKTTIVSAWPRMGNHCEKILQSVLKLHSDIASSNVQDEAKAGIMTQCVECLVLLTCACPSKMLPILDNLKEMSLGSVYSVVLDQILKDSSVTKLRDI